MTAPRVVVAGGGSAEHIEPAMNFADALCRLEPTAEVTALGTVRGPDTTLIPARGYPLELVPPKPDRLRESVQAAGMVLDRLRAEIVVGFGGYVALPAYHAARRQGLPFVVHETSTRPGVATRLAAQMTPHVFTATPDIPLAHAIAIGIPLRPEITGLDRPALRADARRRFGLRPGGPVLLVFGGSPDADSLDAAVSGAAEALRASGVQVLRNAPCVEETRYAYAAADFVLCRAEPLRCAELAAVGLPSAYVPLGEQRPNAEPVVAAGGGLLVEDSELSPVWIETALVPVLTDPARIAAMSARARELGTTDADVVLAQHVLETHRRHRRHSGHR